MVMVRGNTTSKDTISYYWLLLSDRNYLNVVLVEKHAIDLVNLLQLKIPKKINFSNLEPISYVSLNDNGCFNQNFTDEPWDDQKTSKQ